MHYHLASFCLECTENEDPDLPESESFKSFQVLVWQVLKPLTFLELLSNHLKSLIITNTMETSKIIAERSNIILI